MQDEIKITGEPSEAGDRCRFIVDRPLLDGRSAFFGNKEDAEQYSPLAKELLAVEGIKSVLIAGDTVSLTGEDTPDWPALGIGNIIRKHIRSEAPIVAEEYFEKEPKEDDLRAMVQNLFESEINPALAMHGGFVELVDVKGNDLFIRMGGGCQGCGSATATLRFGIENSIRENFPWVGEIFDATDHAAGQNPYFK